MKWFHAALFPLTILGLMAQGGESVLTGPGSEIHFRWQKVTLSDINSPAAFSFLGNPVEILWRDRGIRVTAPQIEGTAPLDTESKQPFLKSLTFTGESTFELDSSIINQFVQEQARKQGVPVPPDDPNIFHLGMYGSAFSYQGDPSQGTLTVPSAFRGNWNFHLLSDVLDDKKQGHKRVTDAKGDMQGASGTFSFLLKSPSPKASGLRSGVVEGPITVHYNQTSTLDGAPEQPVVVTLTAGHAEIHFADGTGTLTVTGNVKVSGMAKGYSFTTDATRAVVTLTEDWQIKDIQMEGTPTTTNVKPPAKGGGAR